MTRTAVIASVLMLGWFVGPLPAWAQGKGHGLNRGLTAASKSMPGGAMARSGGPVARASGGPLRNGAPLGRANSGLERANAARLPSPASPDDGSGTEPALANQQSILKNRLDQADHLRALSQSNGNEHLLDTADRMEANANRNFQRQQTRLGGAGPDPAGGSSAAPAPPSDPAASGSASTAEAASTSAVPRRGLWFRSR